MVNRKAYQLCTYDNNSTNNLRDFLMPRSRTRSVQHKVFIPASARENQYLLAKFAVTDELLAKFSDPSEKNSDTPYLTFYKKLSKVFFDINEELHIDSGQFVGNDKFKK